MEVAAMQDENASRKQAFLSAAHIARAAMRGGLHGAAAATAVETGKRLIKPVLAASAVLFGIPLLFLTAIPCNLFDAPSV